MFKINIFNWARKAGYRYANYTNNACCVFLLTILLLQLMASGLKAQDKLVFDYDASGNRILMRYEPAPENPEFNARIAPSTKNFERQKKNKEFDDSFKEIKITAKPNPAHDYLIITLEGTEQAMLSIKTISGATVFNRTISAGENTINTQSLKAGTYLVHLTSGKTSKTQKLIIQ